MTLNKTIAGYFKEYYVNVMKDDGTLSHREFHREWIDQKNVEMHPLEEAYIKSHWQISNNLLPEKPTPEEEHEWLIEYGADYVKQKRQEWQKNVDAAKPAHEAAMLKCHEAKKAWDDHCFLCLVNKHNPDTYPGDARESLKAPEIVNAS